MGEVKTAKFALRIFWAFPKVRPYELFWKHFGNVGNFGRLFRALKRTLDLVKYLAPCHQKVWIGLGASGRPSNWTWYDNRTPYNYERWALGRGAYNQATWAANKYCAFMLLTGTDERRWVDGACTGQTSVLSTVCQFRADVSLWRDFLR